MNVTVRSINVERSEVIVRHAERSVRLALDCFAAEIIQVVVRLTDQNGPKGGPAMRCQVSASGPRLRTISAVDTATSVEAALDAAADRLARRIERRLARLGRGRRSRCRPTWGDDAPTAAA